MSNATCSPSANAVYAAFVTSSMRWAKPGLACAAAPPWLGEAPWVMASKMIAWKSAGIPSPFSWEVRLLFNWAFVSAPSTATPNTAPSSRLVLVTDAAMPDRSAGTVDSTAVVTGTRTIPKPAPAMTRTTARVGRFTC